MVVIRKTIEGYPDYSIGTDGTIKRIVHDRFLKPQRLRNGYMIVRLTNTDGTKTLYVHRLVAAAFLHNPYNKPCIDHIDRNKEHNSITNLRYCTYSENGYNKNKNKNTKNRYKYVYLNKRGKYIVRMKINQKIKHLGTFKTEKEAVEKSNAVILTLDIKDFLTLQIYTD